MLAEALIQQIKDAVTTDDREGLVVGIKRRREVALRVVREYLAMDGAQRRNLLVRVANDLRWRPPAPDEWASLRTEPLQRVVEAVEPGYARFFHLVASVPQGVEFLLLFRENTLSCLAERRGAVGAAPPATRALRDMDSTLRRLFGTQQSVQLHRIAYTDRDAVDYVVVKEAVRPFGDEGDRRRRFRGPNRVVYGLFHSALPRKPLVFVEVALGGAMPSRVDELLEGDDRPTPRPTHATFYSITNSRSGLRGLQLASHLIFVVADRLAGRHPTLAHFVTLSPVPGFRRWLLARLAGKRAGLFTRREAADVVHAAGRDEVRDPYEAARVALESDLGGATPEQRRSTLSLCRRWLERQCVTYIVFAKQGKKVLDPVANFHVENGARVVRLCFAADLSDRGLSQSYGINVNYAYEFATARASSIAYREASELATSQFALAQATAGAGFLDTLGLTADDLAQVDLPLRARVFRKGEWVARRGRRDGTMYIISEGSVVLYDADGGRRAVGAGECFGQHAAVYDGAYRFDAQAATEVYAWAVRHSVLGGVLDCNPAIAGRVLATVATVHAKL